jgi:hypothetical protein
MDQSGNLYGTMEFGGDPNCNSGFGCGTVFKVTFSNGRWIESFLHRLTGGSDGQQPLAA